MIKWPVLHCFRRNTSASYGIKNKEGGHSWCCDAIILGVLFPPPACRPKQCGGETPEGDGLPAAEADDDGDGQGDGTADEERGDKPARSDTGGDAAAAALMHKPRKTQ
eukprot:7380471-Pyramimonas_sp.AAC.1